MAKNDRLTPEWTETLKEAFGRTGEIGETGEKVVCSILTELGFNYEYCPSNKLSQISGNDIYIITKTGRWGVDVKANLHTIKSEVAVEWFKLKKSQAKYWIHINLSNHDDFIIYEVQKMIKYIEENNIHPVGKDNLCWINKKIARTLN